MAKSALELAVETGKWDAGLKKAKSALDSFTEANGGLQKALSSDSDKMKQFVQMMGRTESTAKTAKGQMNDYKGTIEALTMQYNRMTDAQKSAVGPAYLQAIEQMKQRYKGVADEVAKINQELKQTSTLSDGIQQGGTGGGGLFGGGKLDGMLQVFGGNLMTKGAGMLAGLASEMGDMVKQGIELAKQGEGIRIAFQRLGRGDILDGLRQATHGTVTDLELMKAAVKFNDFKLPLEELGTMLAFAQQKAKDTGQSVDYMVESIVTGLGRKSLMILDNLGLSAAQIKERMAETGDMTKAVGAIIREEMAKAGDYVETAADRATQANVALQNKMEELGRKFAPVEEASNQLWTSIKIGILDIVGGPLADLLNGLTRAGQLRNELKNIGSDERVNSDISKLKGSNFKEKVYTAMLNKYSREEQRALDNFKKAQKGGMGSIAIWENRYLAQKAMREDFQSRGREVLNGGNSKNTPTTPTNTITTTGTTTPVPVKIEGFDPSAAASAGVHGVDTMPSIFGMLKDSGAAGINGAMGSIVPDLSADIEKQQTLVDELREKWAKAGGELRDSYVAQIIEAEDKLRNLKDEQGISQGDGRKPYDLGRDISEKDYKKLPGYDKNKDRDEKKLTEQISKLTSGISSITGGIKAMGFKLPNEVEQVIGVVQGVMAVIEGVNSVISIFGSTSMALNTIALDANTAALWAVAGTNLIPGLARGGVVHAAGGYRVPGNNYSGDMVPAMLNSGELVLNKAQQGNLASQLSGNGLQNLHLTATVHAEQIRLALNNNGQRTGRGELVTWKR